MFARLPSLWMSPPEGTTLPGLRDRALLAILAVTAVLLAVSWWGEEGYQIADSVEYLERAQGIANQEELIDSQAIRGFGFSGLLVPLFYVGKWTGLRNWVHVVHAAQLLQIVFSLTLVVLAARLGARVARPESARACGLGAAAMLGFNPILLRWGVEPISGVAAAVFIAVGMEFVLDGKRARHAALAGLWFGLALMMAYQTILVIGVILGVVFVRDIRRRPRWIAATLGALFACGLVQCLLDWAYYGTFGISVGRYLLENSGSNIALVIHRFGTRFGAPWAVDIAEWLYNSLYGQGGNTREYQEAVQLGEAEIRTRQSYSWYVRNLRQCLELPALGLIAIGLVSVAKRLSWKPVLLGAIVLANVLIMSLKGSKDFRLWLPFLSMLSVFGGLGIAALLGPKRPIARVRGALVGLLILATLVLAARENWNTNTRRFGGYWRAMAVINRDARETLERRQREFDAERERMLASGTTADEVPDELPPVRVSAAYHWSMFLRNSELVELVKLPHHLDAWLSYDAEERRDDLETLGEVDWFVTHLPVLTLHPDLFEAVNRYFVVHSVFYDRIVYEGLGPIYVLRKRRGDPTELGFFELKRNPSDDDIAAHENLLSLEFTYPRDDDLDRMRLLGVRYTPLPGDGHGWIEYTWHGGPFGGREYEVIDVITEPAGVRAIWNNHLPAYGMHRTSTWDDTWLLREGYLVVAEEDPFRPGGESRPLGGDYLKGDLIPADVWMDFAVVNDLHEILERSVAHDARSGRAVSEMTRPGGFASPAGHRTNGEGMTLAGRFFLPRLPTATGD